MNSSFLSTRFVLAVLAVVISPALLNGAKKDAATDPSIVALKKEIPSLMKEAEIPGLSIAVIRNGKTCWLQNFGMKSTKTNESVDDATVFNVGSLSKPVFAYGVLKLVDAGKLKLDEPLAPYLAKEFIVDDPRFQQITARIVLSHRTGFPNWPRDGEKLTINFAPGQRFSYSGAGIVLLSKAVEKITGKPLNDYMQEAVFGPLGMTSSSYVWRTDYEKTATAGHESDGEPVDFFKAKDANAAASLDTTTHDYALFVEAVLAGRGLKASTLREMERPQIAVDPECVNCTDRVPKELSKSVFWGLGWGIQETAEGKALWHWGDNGVYKAYVLVRPKTKSGLVMFANSSNGLAIIKAVLADADGGDQPALSWVKYDNYDSPSFRFLQAARQYGAAAALQQFSSDLAARAISEDALNNLGYRLMAVKHLPDAILILQKNVELHPASANVYDSLGEAYMNDGQKELAIQNYEKALQLKPDSANAVAMLKKLREN
ncbi:MAG: serine hydrolase [Candidatus Sulfotelmatobacter sp.]